MSSNYNLLKESKNELIQELELYFSHIVKSSKDVCVYLKDHNIVDDDFLEQINLAEEKSDILYDDVLKSAIWIIQKNEPRASNLRFIISCINSAKELERTSDYLLLITKFLKKRTIDNKLHGQFMDLFERCVSILEQSFDLFKTNDVIQSRKILKESLSEYEKYLKLQTRVMIKYFNTLPSKDDSHKTLIDLVNSLNGFERIATHVYNVIKSFNYIDL